MSYDVKKFGNIEGKLEEYPFPRVLQFLHERNATGRVALRRGEITKVIFMVEGNPVNVDSTLRDETLGRYLIKKGKINEDDYEKSIQIMIEKNIQQGAALVKLGRLSPKELYHEVKAQSREKLLSCFAIASGSFGFYPEVSFVEDIYRFEMTMPRVMYEGIRRFFPPGAVEKELAKVGSGPIGATSLLSENISSYALTDEESSLVFMVDGERDILALKKAAKAVPNGAKLLYLLMVAGMIGPAGKPEASVRSLGDNELTMPPLEDLFSAASPDTAPEVIEEEYIAPEPASDISMPGPEVFRPVGQPESTPSTEDTEAAVEDDLEEPAIEDTPALARLASVEEENENGEPMVEEEVIDDWDFKKAGEGPPEGKVTSFENVYRDESEILEFYVGIKSQDFFSLLGVGEDDIDDAVTLAYRRLREDNDRGRFPPELSSEANAKLEEIHTRIIRAYEVLRTGEGRKRYRASLETGEETREKTKTALQAEQYLQQGIQAVRKRDWPQAQQMFEKAVAASPEEPEYLGYLGWSIYSNTELPIDNRRQEAKKLLRQAIEINPQMDSSHVFLGKILKGEGKAEDAAESFKNALKGNPGCREAERELKAHEQGEW